MGKTEKLAKAQNKSRKTGNKHKFVGRNNGPARQRYWLYSRLRENKVRRIMKAQGLTRAEAIVMWENARKGRRK